MKRDLGLGSKRTQRNQGLRSGEKPDVGWHKLAPFVLSNLAIAAVPTAFGRPELYLLWLVALLTTYRLALRIRSIAEHAMAGPAEDPLRNTRTTLVRWWERLLLAPVFVNYHLEHHLLMTVPHYRLPQMHAILRDRGLLEGALVTEGGYREVLRRATSAPPEASATSTGCLTAERAAAPVEMKRRLGGREPVDRVGPVAVLAPASLRELDRVLLEGARRAVADLVPALGRLADLIVDGARDRCTAVERVQRRHRLECVGGAGPSRIRGKATLQASAWPRGS